FNSYFWLDGKTEPHLPEKVGNAAQFIYRRDLCPSPFSLNGRDLPFVAAFGKIEVVIKVAITNAKGLCSSLDFRLNDAANQFSLFPYYWQIILRF
ncbi:hypothetical protein C5L28_000438, partial [Lentilactobacillus parakefiri]